MIKEIIRKIIYNNSLDNNSEKISKLLDNLEKWRKVVRSGDKVEGSEN